MVAPRSQAATGRQDVELLIGLTQPGAHKGWMRWRRTQKRGASVGEGKEPPSTLSFGVRGHIYISE